jgi:hypothetical protein
VRPRCETGWALFFTPGWDRYRLDKKRIGTLHFTCVFTSRGICGSCSAFRCIWCAKCRRIFDAQVGPVRFTKKAHRDTLHPTCVFASCGMCGSRSSFRSIRGVKCDRTIVHARVDRYGFEKKRAWTSYAKLMLLHPVGSTGHIVHSGVTGCET